MFRKIASMCKATELYFEAIAFNFETMDSSVVIGLKPRLDHDPEMLAVA